MSLQNYSGKNNTRKLSFKTLVRFSPGMLMGIPTPKFGSLLSQGPTLVFNLPNCFCLVSRAVQLLIIVYPSLTMSIKLWGRLLTGAGLTGTPKENNMDSL